VLGVRCLKEILFLDLLQDFLHSGPLLVLEGLEGEATVGGGAHDTSPVEFGRASENAERGKDAGVKVNNERDGGLVAVQEGLDARAEGVEDEEKGVHREGQSEEFDAVELPVELHEGLSDLLLDGEGVANDSTEELGGRVGDRRVEEDLLRLVDGLPGGGELVDDALALVSDVLTSLDEGRVVTVCDGDGGGGMDLGGVDREEVDEAVKAVREDLTLLGATGGDAGRDTIDEEDGGDRVEKPRGSVELGAVFTAAHEHEAAEGRVVGVHDVELEGDGVVEGAKLELRKNSGDQSPVLEHRRLALAERGPELRGDPAKEGGHGQGKEQLTSDARADADDNTSLDLVGSVELALRQERVRESTATNEGVRETGKGLSARIVEGGGLEELPGEAGGIEGGASLLRAEGSADVLNAERGDHRDLLRIRGHLDSVDALVGRCIGMEAAEQADSVGSVLRGGAVLREGGVSAGGVLVEHVPVGTLAAGARGMNLFETWGKRERRRAVGRGEVLVESQGKIEEVFHGLVNPARVSRLKGIRRGNKEGRDDVGDSVRSGWVPLALRDGRPRGVDEVGSFLN
jgi:hypothetical protein